MVKRSVVAVFAAVSLVLTTVGVLAQEQPAAASATVDRIRERGALVCGVNPSLAGFAVLNETGQYEGFDVDVCRAVAAAVLGDANAVEYRPLEAAERQAAIQSGEIDLMSRNTTWTISRDAVWNATFAPVTFYDGQGIMVRTDLGVATLEDLEGASICVQTGTTTELNLADAFDAAGIAYEPQVFNDASATWEAYLAGRCDAFTTDRSGLAAYRSTAEDPGAHTILDVTLSKEPLAPLSPQGDTVFADIVQWTVYGLIQAEEFGITSENLDTFLTSTDPAIQRFLGLGEQVTALGSLYGISDQYIQDVIRQVGNYGEIYTRHLEPIGLARGLNSLWTDGGLMYAPPFR
ncbi:MAG: amino acid ABC transporter substrate-binding protein [bacterium]|nr:amino acid ABC transporter substrate-binding protein [bacterium]